MKNILAGGDAAFRRVTPILFVVLWSTGFIVARFSADYADPLTFLLARYACAILILLPFALWVGAGWPKTRMQWTHALVSGVLLHAAYLGAVWWAVRHGVSASISALLSAVQPILTPILAPMLLGERVAALQWLGVLLGFAGLLLVLAPKLAGIDPGLLQAATLPLLVNVGGVLALTFGAFYQKRFVHSGDLRTVTVLQYVGALVVTLPAAYALEPMRIEWNVTTISVLIWSVLALSVVSIALLLTLIRRGEVSRSAQLIYLVPPTSALQAWLFFGEAFSLLQLAGLAVTVLGVALASRK
jgi:drug/metabolite transporter (DMT)-like permease